MHTRYKIINRIIDRLTGYDLAKATLEASSFDFLPREQIATYHDLQFRKLSEIASKSHYYKDLLNKPLADFPIMSRQEYQLNLDSMKTGFNCSFQVRHSSGSTGIPVKQYVTREMRLSKRASHQKMLGWYGLTRESPEFKLGGLQYDLKTKIYYYLRNKRHIDSYTLSEKRLPAIIKAYNQFKPEVLYGYPSTINRFLMFAYHHQIQLHQPKIVVTHAENLYQDIRDNINRILPEPKIVNQYWATESNIGVMCPQGNMHIDENTVICEVLNKDSHGVGDLYITNLFSYAVPIIRYSIGDKVVISDKVCTCGRNTRIIESVEGRDFEFLELQDGSRFPITAMQEIIFTENVMYYQLVYHKTEKHIIFKYIPVNKDEPIQKEVIVDFMRDKFGVSTDFLQVNDPEYTQGGKLKRLIIKP